MSLTIQPEPVPLRQGWLRREGFPRARQRQTFMGYRNEKPRSVRGAWCVPDPDSMPTLLAVSQPVASKPKTVWKPPLFFPQKVRVDAKVQGYRPASGNARKKYKKTWVHDEICFPCARVDGESAFLWVSLANTLSGRVGINSRFIIGTGSAVVEPWKTPGSALRCPVSGTSCVQTVSTSP